MDALLDKRLPSCHRDHPDQQSRIAASRILSLVPVWLRLDLDPLRILLPLLCVPMVLLAAGMGLLERILDW